MIINLQLNRGEMATIKKLLSDEVASWERAIRNDEVWVSSSGRASEKYIDGLARRKLKLQKLIALADKLDKVLAE